VIVRWGLDSLNSLLAELGIERPFLIASDRWADLPIPSAGRWAQVPTDRIPDIATAAAEAEADGLLAVGGGSAIDLAKAVSAETGLPVVSVPTTYSGAEWTDFFGVRDPDRRMRGGGSAAQPAGIVYEPRLMLDLPREQSGGTALNALAHCAEALYVAGHNDEGDRAALAGARLIGEALPRVLEDGHDLQARTALLEGAQHAGAALASAGLALGHAMAQALGGRFGIPHGAANALCLPPALRFNERVAAAEIARFGEALGADDPAARAEELARLAGFERLRDLGVPEEGLGEVAEATVVRAGARANPRPATAEQVLGLLRAAW
jgi:maleylacetate reductase